MQATLNVRMDSILKERGDSVLKKHGISTSEAVRSLWSYLAKEKNLPDFLKSADEEKIEKEKVRKIAAAKSLCGIATRGTETDISDQEIKDIIASKYDYELD